MDEWKFRDLVTTGALYFGRANLLDDRFEGTTPEAQLASWREMAERAESGEKRATIEHGRELRSRFASTFSGRYFVSCWHMNEHVNFSMWHLYTKPTKSVSVTVRYDVLQTQLPDKFLIGDMYLGCVRYIDYSVEDFSTMNLLQNISHKRHFFAYENEVRAVLSFAMPFPVTTEEQVLQINAAIAEAGHLVSLNLPDLIESVHVHFDATAEFFDEVAALCEGAGLPSPELSGIAGDPVY